jgi:hypothetical protein
VAQVGIVFRRQERPMADTNGFLAHAVDADFKSSGAFASQIWQGSQLVSENHDL